MSTKNKSEEQTELKRKLSAFGYLSEVGKLGNTKRKKFYVGTIVFIALLAIALYLSASTFSVTQKALISSPATMIDLLRLGLVVGTIVGLTSVGSGALMTPILYLDFSRVLTHAQAVGTATTQGTVTKIVASIRNYMKKSLKSGYAFMIAIGGVPAAVVGAFLTKWAANMHYFPSFPCWNFDSCCSFDNTSDLVERKKHIRAATQRSIRISK